MAVGRWVVRLTTNPINKNYCAYETLQHDRLPEKLPGAPNSPKLLFRRKRLSEPLPRPTQPAHTLRLPSRLIPAPR